MVAAPGATTPTGAVASAGAAAPIATPDPARERLRELRARGSLRGSERDGRVTLAADGTLVVDAELRRLFDHYLALIGELDTGGIRALIADDLRREHAAHVAQQVLDLFDRYVACQRALAQLDPAAIADLALRAERVRRMRREWLGTAADGLYGDEERALEAALQRRSVLADASLDAAARAQRLAAIDVALEPEHAEARRLASTALLADEQTRQFEALAIDPAERHAERAALWGATAADRLAALDRERALWQRRVAAYAAARAALLADASLDAARRDAALRSLRASSFGSAAEQRRIEALESAGLLGDL